MAVKSKVEALPSSLIALAVDDLFQRVFSSAPVDEISALMTGVAPLDALRKRGDDELAKSLSQADSVELGRALLMSYAEDAALAPLVEQACDHALAKSKNDLVVGTLLTVGLVTNLTYLIMATSVTVKKGADGKLTWKVEKRASPPDFISGVLKKLISLGAAK